MKIAWLHFTLSGGPMEDNVDKISQGIADAAKAGAQWILTPEMALQGYFMTRMERTYEIISLNSAVITHFQELAKYYKITLFLGCAEHDEINGNNYNSCIVIGANGAVIGRHRKMKTVKWITEAWSVPGEKLTMLCCDKINTGILVCADAWFEENAIALGECGAEAIVVIAAWPPGCGGPPENAWRRCSNSSGGLVVLICNQTGKINGMDCTIAKSAVVIDGELKLKYCGVEAILLAEIDLKNKQILSEKFKVIEMEVAEA